MHGVKCECSNSYYYDSNTRSVYSSETRYRVDVDGGVADGRYNTTNSSYALTVGSNEILDDSVDVSVSVDASINNITKESTSADCTKTNLVDEQKIHHHHLHLFQLEFLQQM